MTDEQVVERTSRAIEIARRAWDNAHRDGPRNPMTRAAAIPATGILAAAVLPWLDGEDDDASVRHVERAISLARRAWQQGRQEPPGNPIAATAEKSVIGIIAAGILNAE